MITNNRVREWALALFNDAPSADPAIEVGIYEFDLGFVVWPVEREPADWTRPPSMIGGSVLVIDRETGNASMWRRLAGPHVAELYRHARARQAGLD